VEKFGPNPTHGSTQPMDNSDTGIVTSVTTSTAWNPDNVDLIFTQAYTNWLACSLATAVVVDNNGERKKASQTIACESSRRHADSPTMVKLPFSGMLKSGQFVLWRTYTVTCFGRDGHKIGAIVGFNYQKIITKPRNF